MSRTYRKPSKMHKSSKIVRDGTPTKAAHSCENNGGCPYCESNRLHKHRKQPSLKQEIEISRDV